MDSIVRALIEQAKKATKPLMPQFGEYGAKVEKQLAEHDYGDDPMMARLRGFGYGAARGAGELLSDMTSPLSLATMVMTAGAGRGASQVASTASKARPIEALAEYLNAGHVPSLPAEFSTAGQATGKAVKRGIVDPVEAAYNRLLANGGKAVPTAPVKAARKLSPIEDFYANNPMGEGRNTFTDSNSLASQVLPEGEGLGAIWKLLSQRQ